MRKIILASQSPRRSELLSAMGVPFRTVSSSFEEHLDDSRDPAMVAIQLALGKALTVSEMYPGDIIIGSDTIVFANGRQLGKPRDISEAREMLASLSGKTHTVITAVALICKESGTQLSGADATEVVFKTLDENAIDAYVNTGDCLDKAGAYGIQSGAAPLIDHIEGNYDTVVGFPTQLVGYYLGQMQIPSKPVALSSPVSVYARRPQPPIQQPQQKA
jgi:septum formation protein